MRERIKQEIALVEAEYGELELGPDLEWFIVKRWSLCPGWNRTETQVLVLVPPGYTTTPPDNFYVDADLRLAGGGDPGNTSGDQTQAGRVWRQFSYHVEGGDWRPHADLARGHNLLTFMAGVARRLSEAN